MADLSIKLDTRAISRKLADVQRQIPFTVAVAVNDLAFQAMRAENGAISDIFAHPRPFTTRATQVKKATKANLTAEVSLRDQQAKYLTPYETGGLHAISAKDGAGDLLVPADGKTDAYGQIPRGLIKRLMARPDIFFGTIRGITGIWQRPPRGEQRQGRRGTKGKLNIMSGKQSGLKLLYVFKPNRDVTKHLGFEQRAVELVQRQGTKAIEAAIAKALTTARP